MSDGFTTVISIPELKTIILKQIPTIDSIWSLRTLSQEIYPQILSYMDFFWKEKYIEYYGTEEIHQIDDFLGELKKRLIRPSFSKRNEDIVCFNWKEDFFDARVDDCLRLLYMEALMFSTSAETSFIYVVEYDPITGEMMFIERDKVAFAAFYGLNCMCSYFMEKKNTYPGKTIQQEYLDYRYGMEDNEAYVNARDFPNMYELLDKSVVIDREEHEGSGEDYKDNSQSSTEKFPDPFELERGTGEVTYSSFELEPSVDIDFTKRKPSNVLLFDNRIKFDIQPGRSTSKKREWKVNYSRAGHFYHASMPYSGIFTYEWHFEKERHLRTHERGTIRIQKEDGGKIFCTVTFHIIDLL
eukprot:TRINITY_DN7688_c0_g1_i1.p1 TRINITY_DN7688_c0_g1~~TRINITY_DN7688_c0_g1_i1.p1  ORF type:complete len:355 (+),score=68.34 TRINITY_DN7688_c0_g1_i1:16-1080(+)